MKNKVVRTINALLASFMLFSSFQMSTVNAEGKEIVIQQDEVTLKMGETETLQVETTPTGREVIFSSEDENVVTVDNEGNLQTVNAGKTTVKATLADVDVAALEEALENAKASEAERKSALDAAEADVDAKNKAIEDIQNSIEELKPQIASAEETLADAKDRQTTIKANEQELQNAYDAIVEEETVAKENLANAKAAYDADLLNADSNIANAQGEVDAAKAELTNVQNKVNSGSYGFFEWHEANSMAISYLDERLSIQETDASITEEMKTKLGQDGDATSLENMKKALELIPEGNSLRASDNHNAGENKTALKVTDYLMAVAQVQTNASASTQGHTSWARVGENLAWGYNRNRSPYEGWYTDEKAVYDYYLEHPNATKAEVVEALGLPSEGFVQTGHYLNIANPKDEENRRYITTGFGVNTVISSYGTTHGQTFGASYTQAGTAYTVEEYTADFNEYYDSLDSELATAEQNVTEKEATLTTLKNNNGVKEDIANAYRDAQDALATIQEEKATAEAELAKATAESEAIDKEVADAQAAYDALKEEEKTNAQNLASATDSLSQAEQKHAEESANYDDAVNAVKVAQNDLEKISDTVEVTVQNVLVESIQLNELPKVLYKGNTCQIEPTVAPDDAFNKTVSYQSSDTTVATVDQSGKVSANAPGTATITVSATDGSEVKATITITVKNTGWIKDSKGWNYINTDGTRSEDKWQKIGGKWYHFDKSGYMQTGWLKDGGEWYYLNSSGVMQKGWVKIGGKYYYMNSSGVMQTGWVKVGTKYYYMNSSGVMQTSKWIGNYYVEASGAMATNKWIGNYHVNASGKWDKTR